MRRPARIAQGRNTRPVPTKSPARQAAATAPAPALTALLQDAVAHHQAGRFGEAEQRYRQVLALDAQQPDALHLLGVLAYQVGRPDAAVSLIEQAIQQRPASPSFRLNLGNALLALGRTDDAVAAYREATALAPHDAEAYYNLGNALVEADQTEDGIAALRQAIRLNPAHVAAQYNLGNALRATDCLDEAVTAYAAVIRLQPAHADAHTNLGSTLHALGRLDEAAASFERALTSRPGDPVALANLGEALREQGVADRAADLFRQALAADPTQPTALRSLAALAVRDGRPAEAADLLGRRVQTSPDDASAHEQYVRALVAAERGDAALVAALAGWERHPDHRPLLRALLDVLQTAPVEVLAGPGRPALMAACSDDTFDAQHLATPVARLFMSQPEYPGLLAAVRAGLDPLAHQTPLPPALISDPLVLAALPRLIICAIETERIFTALRRSLLLGGTPGAMHLPQPTPNPQPPLPQAGEEEPLEHGMLLPRAFVCALAGAAFLVEHTWHVEADEQQRLDSLRADLTALLADPVRDPADAEDGLLLAALYDRLGRLPGAERLAEIPDERWSAPFVAIVREQVREPLAERALAAALPTLTPVDDDVSQNVRAMYEENPYPRWRATRSNGVESMADRYRFVCPGEPVPRWPEPIPVLVAGAGTGRHPIHVALRLPGAEVLAVDLSRTSLAYGARMAEQMGVHNIRFAQADILALDALDRQFAHIECCGVLHHLADPLAGWAVLRRLLRPDGLMLIALYSERARTSVVAARALLQTEGIQPTREGIRAARRRVLDLPPEHPVAPLTKFWDFYSESGFRDLAMHVQEHRFTPPQIGAALDALDLEFLGFEVTPEVQAQFRARFPQPGADRDLACWDAFEAEHPDTFASMFQLWCRPR